MFPRVCLVSKLSTAKMPEIQFGTWGAYAPALSRYRRRTSDPYRRRWEKLTWPRLGLGNIVGARARRKRRWYFAIPVQRVYMRQRYFGLGNIAGARARRNADGISLSQAQRVYMRQWYFLGPARENTATWSMLPPARLLPRGPAVTWEYFPATHFPYSPTSHSSPTQTRACSLPSSFPSSPTPNLANLTNNI
jgi:hypothetical protein